MASKASEALRRTIPSVSQSVTDRFSRANDVLLAGSSLPHTNSTAEAEVAPVQDEGSGPYKVGQSYDVPLNKIREYKYNARVYYTAGEIDKMSNSLKNNSQEVDAIGFYEDGYVYLIEGQMRWRGGVSGGLSTLRVTFRERPQSARESYLKSRRINLERSAQTPIDDAARWRQLLDEKVFESQKQLADAMNLSESNVSRTIAIGRIPDAIRPRLLENSSLSSLRGAFAISTVFDTEKVSLTDEERERIVEDVIDVVTKTEMSVPQLEKLVESRIQGPRHRERGVSIPVRYGSAKGSLKLNRTSGKLDLSIAGLGQAQLDDLQQMIESMLKGQ